VTELKFTDEGARHLERLYRTSDIVAQRDATLRRLSLRRGHAVIDLGSGPGFLCESMADIVGPAGRVLGVDISPDLVALSARRNTREWLSYRLADATAVDEPDASFDVVVCTQVAEYIAQVDRALSEAFRLLKPGGRALFMATDWDGVIWHSEDPARMAAVMKAWEAHCAHPRLPRTLGPRMRSAGLEVEDVTVYPLLNLEWTDDTYSKGLSASIAKFVAKRSSLGGDVVAAWHDELAQLDAQGRYFFSSSRFIFVASKPL